MFDRLASKNTYPDVEELGDRIKKFFRFYGINRHKLTTITPSFHYNPEACDDNRFDMRPLMYATDWKYQFDIIDMRIKEFQEKMERKSKSKSGSGGV